jgi:hypothetical protein
MRAPISNVYPWPYVLSTVRSSPIRRQTWRLIVGPRPVAVSAPRACFGLREGLEEPPGLLLRHRDPDISDGEL